MSTAVRWVGALMLASVLGLASAQLFSTPVDDIEADLTSRIAHESNLVKKAKYETRLARLKLIQAKDAREKGEFEASQKLLEVYLQTLTSAWKHLQESGRLAHKNPQGFKELDIELREDARYLEDLRRSVSVLDREPVEKVIREAERIRGEVLKALFPAMAPGER